MKVARTPAPGKWYPVDLFKDEKPQPEVKLHPVHQYERSRCTIKATEIMMVPHPAKPGQYLQAERVDSWTFTELIAIEAIEELKHVEDNDGKPIEATPDGIRYLLRTLPAEFALWLQKLIIAISDEADLVRKEQKEQERKNS